MELTSEVSDAYTLFRANGILKGMVQTEPGQGGGHFVRLFCPDVATADVPLAETFENGVAMVTAHVEANEVRTWADAFGVWHASVSLGSPNRAERARRAIVTELEQREGSTFDPSAMRVRLVSGERGRATYAENWDDHDA